ncbi:replicative DNA helicase [Leptospira phage LE4]|uniref:Replicative DNA helicase n=1 Tax=Leptospira phage LE4 TaxID=2041383 RepID=A0A343LEG8_9CAUD|nr:replicative DNA helicase [Leptospira phage LE4]ATN95078.1 replicative DNA helicase [Leptospira phage LE4]
MQDSDKVKSIQDEIQNLSRQREEIIADIKAKKFTNDVNIDNLILDLREAKKEGNHSQAIRILENLNDAVKIKIADDNRSLPEQITDYAKSSNPIKYPWDLDLWMKNGGSHILGARPGVGKTTLALNFCYQSFKAKQPSIFYSFEQVSADIWIKLLQFYLSDVYDQQTKYNEILGAFRRSEQFKELHNKISEALEQMKEHIVVVDATGWTVQDISASYEEQRNNLGARRIQYVVVDYIQRVRPGRGSGSTKLEKIEGIVMDLTSKIKRTNSAWIILSQLTRQRNDVKNQTPDSSWFKETGTIEEDATQAVILQRQKDSAGAYSDILEMHVVKNRYGRVGEYTVKMETSTGFITRGGE